MSRDQSPVPQALPRHVDFRSRAFGLFLHWGVYSQLGRGEWIQHRMSAEEARDYAKLAGTFTAEDFDADAWARLAVDAGMRYAVLTSRHHDGFSLYDTSGLDEARGYDSVHGAPAKRDLVGEFIGACRRHDVKPILYHTTLDWHWRGKKTFDLDEAEFGEYLKYLRASVERVCTAYGEIGGLWFDGHWSRPDLDWHDDELYAPIRRHQPEAIIVNNSGLSARGAIGHPEVDVVTFEQGTAEPLDLRGQPTFRVGETCRTMNQHWGVGADDFNYMAPPQVIRELCQCRRAGANYLLNVGPLAQGGIPAYEAACLRRVGEWFAPLAEILREGAPVPEAACSWPGDFVLERDGRHYYFAHDIARSGDAHVSTAGGTRGPRSVSSLGARPTSARWTDASEQPVTVAASGGIVAFQGDGWPYGVDRVVRVCELS